MADHSDKFTYLITRKGASHRRKEDGKWVAYSADPSIGSNQITLTEKQFNSGNYNHLGLRQVTATEAARLKAASDPVVDNTVNPPIQNKVTDASRTEDGNQTQEPLNTGNENVGDGTTKTPEQLAAETKDNQLNDFIARVEAAGNAGDFKKVRDELVGSKVLGDADGVVPDKKKDVLVALRGALSSAASAE